MPPTLPTRPYGIGEPQQKYNRRNTLARLPFEELFVPTTLIRRKIASVRARLFVQELHDGRARYLVDRLKEFARVRLQRLVLARERLSECALSVLYQPISGVPANCPRASSVV